MHKEPQPAAKKRWIVSRIARAIALTFIPQLNFRLILPRILSIDYGAKRTGLAVTDPLKIIASGLTGLHTKELENFLTAYFKKEDVELVIVGHPTNLDDSATHATPLVQAFINRFKKVFPRMPIIKVDERYTSKLAVQSMVESGMKKKDRQNKNLVDEIAATIMLQEYLNSIA